MPRKFLGVGALALALAAQGLVLLLAVFVVVIGPVFRSEPEFSARKTIFLPQRELEHQVAVAEFQEMAPPPAMLDRLSVESLRPQSLPPMPELPAVEFNPVLMDAPLLEASALLGQSGLLGGLGEAGAAASEISFFGLKERASRIVICFDVSQSVKTRVERAGLSMLAVKEEAADAVRQLNANTLFGFIQFSRHYDTFRDYLVTATMNNKEAALAWLEAEFRTDGRSARGWTRGQPNGLQSVLEAAFRLDPAPDAVIIVSDGSFQRNNPLTGGSQHVPWNELARDLARLQEGLPEPARLHFVGFQMRPADKAELQRLVRLYGGRLREID
ncbi:MAG: hypothetical protein ACLFR7_11680 [Opitutales bacterium]